MLARRNSRLSPIGTYKDETVAAMRIRRPCNSKPGHYHLFLGN